MKVTHKKWTAPPDKIRKNLPRSYFLIPKQKLFPYREWQGRLKGYININAVKVAIPRAIATKHTTAYRRAKQLLKKIKR